MREETGSLMTLFERMPAGAPRDPSALFHSLLTLNILSQLRRTLAHSEGATPSGGGSTCWRNFNSTGSPVLFPVTENPISAFFTPKRLPINVPVTFPPSQVTTNPPKSGAKRIAGSAKRSCASQSLAMIEVGVARGSNGKTTSASTAPAALLLRSSMSNPLASVRTFHVSTDPE